MPLFGKHNQPSIALVGDGNRKVTKMRDNREAQHVAEQILEDAPVGTEIFFSDDDATAHYSRLNPDKGLHVDGWKAVKRGHGDITVSKKWARMDNG